MKLVCTNLEEKIQGYIANRWNRWWKFVVRSNIVIWQITYFSWIVGRFGYIIYLWRHDRLRDAGSVMWQIIYHTCITEEC